MDRSLTQLHATVKVWNYDPIFRGLKLDRQTFGLHPLDHAFGTMTRFLGD